MKRTISILFCILTVPCFAQVENLPEFVQQRIDLINAEATRTLIEYRTESSQENLPRRLGFFPKGYKLSYAETQLIDSLGLNIGVGMVYDDDMRSRIVQLMRNEYREGELDTLVDRRIRDNLATYENDAMEMYKFDTIQLFRNALDSFYIELKNKDMAKFPISMYKYDVFKLLKLDTLETFVEVYQEVISAEKTRVKNNILASPYNYTYLAELCGYIGDERFVKPLTEALSKPDNFDTARVLEALARMKVEPYYSEYVKNRTRTAEQINGEQPSFGIEELVYVLGTQESFLELSKYLHSDYPWQYESIDDEIVSSVSMFDEAFILIKSNVRNADLQEMLNNKTAWDNPEIRMPLYDWMQKNYGSYEILKIW